MKKTFVFIFSFLSSITFIYSQLQIGGEIGPSISNMGIQGDGDLIPSTHVYTGIKAGINVKYNGNAGLGIESGAYYRTSGFKVRVEEDFKIYGLDFGGSVTAIPVFKFVEVPLMANYSIGNDRIKASFGAGAYAAYALDGDIKTRGRFLIDFNLGTYDLNMNNDLFNRWDVGLMAKAGLDIPMNKMNIHFNTSYQHGLTDLSDEPILDIRTKPYALNFGVGLSYKF